MLRRRARRHRTIGAVAAGGAHAARRLLERARRGGGGVGDHRVGHRAGCARDDGCRDHPGGGGVDLRRGLPDRRRGDPAHRARRGGRRPRRGLGARLALLHGGRRTRCPRRHRRGGSRATLARTQEGVWRDGPVGAAPRGAGRGGPAHAAPRDPRHHRAHRTAARRTGVQRLPCRRWQPASEHSVRRQRSEPVRARAPCDEGDHGGVHRRGRNDHRGARDRARQASIHGSALHPRDARRHVCTARGVRSRPARQPWQGRPGAQLSRMARRTDSSPALGVSVVAAPSDTASVAAMVREARSTTTPMRIVGAGTWLDAGRPVRADATLALAGLRGITEFEPGDFTLTARAGTSVAEIGEVAAKDGQWLTLEPHGSGDGTIGATIATASWGPLASAYGTARDHLLGCEVVTGLGDIVRAGGRVVKNVAGFDLARLMTGAWGTLGAITEVTVRLRAKPEVDHTLAVALEGTGETAFDGAELWLRATPYRPLAAELCSPAMSQSIGLERRTLLLVRLGGNDALVRAAEHAVR